jgi:hypothetical protein
MVLVFGRFDKNTEQLSAFFQYGGRRKGDEAKDGGVGLSFKCSNLKFSKMNE